jgi:hypothetical protein
MEYLSWFEWILSEHCSGWKTSPGICILGPDIVLPVNPVLFVELEYDCMSLSDHMIMLNHFFINNCFNVFKHDRCRSILFPTVENSSMCIFIIR